MRIFDVQLLNMFYFWRKIICNFTFMISYFTVKILSRIKVQYTVKWFWHYSPENMKTIITLFDVKEKGAATSTLFM